MADLTISVDIDAKGTKNGADQANRAVKSIGDEAQNTARKTQSLARVDFSGAISKLKEYGSQIQSLGQRISGAGQTLTLVLSSAILLLGTLGITSQANIEKAEVSFGRMIKNSKGFTGSLTDARTEAGLLIKDLQKFADATPFESEDVISAGSTLLSAKIPREEIKGYLTDMGDLAAVNADANVSIQDVAKAFGRLKSGDFGEAFERLRDFKIGKEDLIEKGLKFDGRGQFVGSAEEAMNAVRAIIKERFGGTMDDLSQTLSGRFSTLLDKGKGFFRELFLPAFEYAKPAIDFIIQNIEGLTTSLTQMSPQAKLIIVGILGGLAALGPALVIIGGIITAIGTLVGAFASIASGIAAIGGLSVALPIIAGVVAALGLLVVGIGAAVGVVYGLVDAWQNGFGPVASYVALVVGGILTAISPILGLPILIGAVLATIYGIWTTNFGGIRDVVATVVNEVTALVSNFIAQISPYIVDGVRFIQQKFAEYWNKFAPVVADSSNQIRTFLFETWTEISRFLQENLAGITEYFRENWDSIKEAVGRVMVGMELVIRAGLATIRQFWADHGEQIKSVALSAWNIVKTIVGGIVTQIGNVIKLTAQLINGDWAGAWQTFKNMVAVGVNGIISILGSALNIIWQIIKGVVTRIISIGSEIVGGLIGISKLIFGSIVQLALFIVDSFVNALTFGLVDSDLSGIFANWFNGETATAKTEISNSFGEVNQTISQQVQDTQNIANENPFWEKFTESWTSGVNAALPVIKQSGEDLKKTIQDLSQNANLSPELRKNLTSELKNIEKTISSEGAKIAEKFKDLQKTLKTLLNDPRVSTGLKTAIQKELQTIDTNIQNATPQINKSSQTLGQNIPQGTINGINQNKGDVQTAVNNLSIVNPQPFFKAGWEGGVNIGLGMVAGVNSKREDLVWATSSFAKLGAAAISKTIKARSPSKVTQQLGEWFGEGFIVGLQNKRDNIAKVSKKIVKDALGEMRKEAAKAKKEFDDLLGSSFEKQNLIVSIADFQTAKSNLETLIKLRAELGLNVGQALPSTLPQITAEIDALNEQKAGREDALRLLKEYEDAVKNYGVELTHVQKIEQLLNDPNRSLLISAETAEKLKAAAADRDRLDAAKRLDDFKKSIESSALSEQFNLSEQNRLMQEQIRLGRELTGVEKATISQEFDLAKLETSDNFLKLSPEQQESLREFIKLQNESTIALLQDGEALKATIDANKTYSDLLSELNGKTLETNNLTEVGRVQKLLETEAYKNLDAAQKEVLLNKAAEVDSYNDQIKAAEEARQKMEAIYNGLSDSIRRVLSASVRGGFKEGLKTAFDELKNFGLSLLDTILKELSNKLAQFILKKIFGGSSSGSSGSGGGIFGGIFDSIKKLFGGGGSSGGSSSSGGGIFSSIKNLFGFGRGSSSGSSNALGAHESAHAAQSGGGIFSSIKNLFGFGRGSSSGSSNALGAHESAHAAQSGGGRFNLSSGVALAGMAASAIGGMVGGRFGNVLSMAGTGLSIGMQFGGPIGAAIGAGAGALFGFLMGDPKRKIDKKENMPKLTQGFSDALAELRKLAADKNALYNDPEGVLAKASEIRSQIAGGFGIQFQSKKYGSIAKEQIAAKLIEADAIIKSIREMGDEARQAIQTDKRLETSFAGGVFMDRAFMRQFGNFKRRNGMLSGAFTGRDSLPSLLAPGEAVLNPYQMDAVRRNAGFDVFQGAGIPNYASGTFVAPSPNFGSSTATNAPTANSLNSSNIIVEPQFTLHLSGVVAIDGEVSAYLETSDGKKKVVKIVQDDNKFNRK